MNDTQGLEHSGFRERITFIQTSIVYMQRVGCRLVCVMIALKGTNRNINNFALQVCAAHEARSVEFAKRRLV